jgi:DeoR/GlpR family transcriptional regulator of sugar metabolism
VIFRENREASPKRVPAAAPSQSDGSLLNFRQLKLLDGLKPEEFIHVKSYGKRFKISEITACRDLAVLSRLGLVVRVGRARATRYMLPKGN